MLRTIVPTLALCLLVLAGGSGCSGTSLSVHHANVRSGSSDGLGVVVYLAVENNNSFDVEIRRVQARVTMAGRYHLAPVDVSPNKWLRANKTTLVAVPMTIPWPVVPQLLASTSGSSGITYRVKGTADVTAGRSARIRRNGYPVDEDGTIPRRLVVNASRGALPF
jgi:hypothetical protein